MTTTLRLEATGLLTLPITIESGYRLRRFDLGAPEVRASVEDLPDADGTLDTTAHIGARSVAIQCRLIADGTSMQARRDALLRYGHPRVRSTLYYSTDDGVERRIGLRASSFSAPWESATSADMTMQWVAPLGISESSVLKSAQANASGVTLAGRTYPLTFPRVYPASAPGGQTIATNAGTIDAYPVIRLYGPAGSGAGTDDIVIENRTQGKSIVLTGLTVNAGEFVELDTRNRTVFYLGLASDSRYPTWNLSRSEWWSLSPGANDIRYSPETFTAPAQAIIEWRDAWL